MSKTPLISIISVNYNGLDVTCEMIESVRKNSYSNFEIIVVDNASKESPKAYLNKHYPEVKVIESKENLGFSGGNNLGIEICKGDYIFLLNNDAELTNEAMESMLTLFEQVSNLGVVSPKICFYKGESDKNSDSASFDLLQYVGTTPVHNLTARNETIGYLENDKNQYQNPKPTAYAHGAAMVLKREVIEEVGMMPEEFFLYYEELDWCEQIRRAGYEIYVQPTAKIYPKESISVGKFSTLKTYYINRNRILFMRRNRQDWQVAVFCLFLIFVVLPKNSFQFILKRDFKNLKSFWSALGWNLKDRFKNNRRVKNLENDKQLPKSPKMVGATA